MIHTFDYSPLPGLERTGVLAPMIPVTFINGIYRFSTFALVDSGAESGVVSTVIADALGIDWANLEQQTGLTMSGGFKYRTFENLEIEIEGNSFMMSLNIAEGINAFKCILGRNDIFKKARIEFRGYERKFDIEFRKLN